MRIDNLVVIGFTTSDEAGAIAIATSQTAGGMCATITAGDEKAGVDAINKNTEAK